MVQTILFFFERTFFLNVDWNIDIYLMYTANESALRSCMVKVPMRNEAQDSYFYNKVLHFAKLSIK